MSEAHYDFRPASGAFSAIAEGVWHLRSGARGSQVIAPDGCCEIIVHRGAVPIEHRADGSSTRQPDAFLYGPLTRVLRIEQDADMEVFAVRLRPWAVGAFTARPAEWRDRLVGLAELGLELTADTFDDFAAQAEAKLTPLPLPDAAGTVQAAIARMESGALASLDAAADAAGITVRTLDRRFERVAGLTAAMYLRLVRFHRARDAIKAGAGRLSDVAADAGYADQAHMTRDFRRFAGETPKLVRQPAAFDPLYR
ncbi:helix-turn-helix domain-containing protein [Hyphobacterium sp. SN044]|uniref:AraC family transcriptional regulator n=1 Tax=Hyphobacterium sp. SN044 TaxID=2912575 RepID=UPI001F2595D1|nr:helix-turn-helix domain-containing protein [Hyphobacterium sp. SN044]MCF8880207.1 helix-turn-helix domain-containing protein [Hyphobacterium sp. SN044]